MKLSINIVKIDTGLKKNVSLDFVDVIIYET